MPRVRGSRRPSLAPTWTIATSIPHEDAQLATMAIGLEKTWLSAVARQDNVPNGTGDLFAALFTGYRLAGQSRNTRWALPSLA